MENWLEKLESFEKRIKKLEEQLSNKQDKKKECNHLTVPFGQHKRKCGKCGEIFIVD